ncbi:MAG: tetratricopeptide repeat protein, partial [Verrucomicrobiia bacterium]
MNEQSHDRRWLWWGAFSIALLATIIAHVRGLHGQFLEWDDYAHITQNPVIRTLTPENLRTIFTGYTAKLYLPLTWFSFAIDYQIWGRDPFGYHFTNLLLHVANTLLVLVLVYRVVAANLIRGSIPDGRESVSRLQELPAPVAVLTAAIFGVHPLRVESVAWVTERKDVLFAFFYLLALLAHLRWLTSGRRAAYWGCLLLFIASALSKSTAVTLPLVLVLFDWFWKRRVALWEKAPHFAVSLIISAATFVAQSSGAGETVAGTGVIPFWARTGLVGYCSLFYVKKFFWPFHLSAIYPSFEDFDWTPLCAAAYLAGFFAVFAAAFAVRRRAPAALPSWLFYLVTLSPTIGLIPVGVHIVADRFTYLPLLGLALPVSIGLVTLANRTGAARVAAATVVVAWLAGLTFLSARRSAEWTNTETLFQSALEEDPHCYPALVNLTVYYTDAKRLDEAIAYGRRAVEVAPNGLIGRKDLARALIQAKQYREAVTTLRPAVEHGIDDPAVWRALYDCFTALGDEKNAQVAQQRLR